VSTPGRNLVRRHEASRFAAPATLRPVRLGTVVSLPGEVPFDLSEEMLNMHMAVLGVSGGGKSKFLELLCRRLMLGGERGLCLIDPHGDTAEDLLAYATYRYAEKDPSFLARVHYVYPGKGIIPRYDPFRRPDLHLPRWRAEDADDAWLQAKADRLAEILQMKQGQDGFEGMPRLQRVLRNCLYGCGRIVNGRHLSVADALVLLDIYHPQHHQVYRLIEPRLDHHTRSDFAVLHQFQRVSDFRQETESTFNRLRSFLAGVVQGMFVSDGTSPTIDWHAIVRNRDILLVNLRETEFFSREQKSAVGQLIIHEVLTAIANTDRRHREPFNLVIDEAGEFLCEDLKRALGAVRKYKLSITLAGQDLSTFKSEKTDLTNKILSQCGTLVCFQQQSDEDLEVLQPRLGRGNYDFAKLYHEAQFSDGHDVEVMEDTGEGFMDGESWGESRSQSHSRSLTDTESASDAEQSSYSHGRSSTRGSSVTRGHSETRSESHTTSHGHQGGESRGPRGGFGRSESESHGASQTRGRSSSESVSEGRSESEGISDTHGGGESHTQGRSHAVGESAGEQAGSSRGGNKGHTKSVTRKTVLVPRYRLEEVDTGRLVESIADQAERQKHQLFTLDTGEAIVKFRRLPYAFIIRTDLVKEVYADESLKFDVLAWGEELVFAQHPYNHVPRLEGAQDERLARLLYQASEPKANGTHDATGGALA
jgi:hypothetical protein